MLEVCYQFLYCPSLNIQKYSLYRSLNFYALNLIAFFFKPTMGRNSDLPIKKNILLHFSNTLCSHIFIDLEIKI